ncbi:hypothetical protein AB0B63_20040 [Micromonospora sp. NPDC049081]|uniref:hypothetical protein n=1 Tax=Micromonospora sp. NPDC049081 TaxID=3155150 RepID=UPI0033FA478E
MDDGSRWPTGEPTPAGDPWPALPDEPTVPAGTVPATGARDTCRSGGTPWAGVPAGAVAGPWPALPDDGGSRTPLVAGLDDVRYGRLDAEQRGW